jgi:uncharacterized membrane protein YhhN
MTQASAAFLVIATVMSLLNWFAVGKKNAILEYISKPAATIAFLAAVALFDVVHDVPWGWRLAAFAFCLAGDVFLMLPKDAFIPGLASFAVAQILFSISFATGETTATRVILGLVVAIPLAVFLARRFVKAIRASGHGELVAPVCVYMVVISAMAVGAIGSGNAVAIAGALIFMASDSLIAETRFIKERAWHSVGIMVTYHAALAGLALSIL